MVLFHGTMTYVLVGGILQDVFNGCIKNRSFKWDWVIHHCLKDIYAHRNLSNSLDSYANFEVPVFLIWHKLLSLVNIKKSFIIDMHGLVMSVFINKFSMYWCISLISFYAFFLETFLTFHLFSIAFFSSFFKTDQVIYLFVMKIVQFGNALQSY